MDNILTRINDIESKIDAIVERNRRVEAHKSWETSRTRLCAVTTVTYVTMVLVFTVLGSGHPIADALVPTTGFFLSTLSLPFVRRVWERKFQR